MGQLPDNELSARAMNQCSLLMNKMIDADIISESANASTKWNPILHRNVFSQTMDVWREFDDIEVVVSKAGQILKFRDKNRFLNATYFPLQDKDVFLIAGTTGLVGNYATVQNISPGPNGMLIATIEQKQSGFPDSILFTINPSTRQVAAFEVTKVNAS